MIARLIQLNPEVAEEQQMKMGLSETILSLEVILFWTVALLAASLVLSAALLWEKMTHAFVAVPILKMPRFATRRSVFAFPPSRFAKPGELWAVAQLVFNPQW